MSSKLLAVPMEFCKMGPDTYNRLSKLCSPCRSQLAAGEKPLCDNDELLGSAHPILPWSSCSVDLDGVFAKRQELEELVSRPLLQSHEGPCFLLQILVRSKDDFGPFLCFLVTRAFKELLQGLLIQALKDVGHSFLTQACVKVVPMDGGAHPKGC